MKPLLSHPAPSRQGEEAWSALYLALRAADGERTLSIAELEQYAAAAHLTGRTEESVELWARGYHALVAAGETGRAVRVACQLALRFRHQREDARAGGWTALARRLVVSLPEGAEAGFLLLPDGLAKVVAGDAPGGLALFERAARIAERWKDRELALMALHGRGRALLRLGRTEDGVAALDELMLAVTHGEVPAPFVGEVYCSMLVGCQEAYDLRRAREWTDALVRWCRTQGEDVPFRIHCLLHRAEILQWQGAWSEAFDEANAARMMRGSTVEPGLASYRIGEVHRLRGEFAEAESAYRESSVVGRSPQPGFALLRLAQGQHEQAIVAIRRAIVEVVHPHARPPLLAAGVEIALAVGDRDSAAGWVQELEEVADGVGAPLLRATALQARGGVALATGDLVGAMAALRAAGELWREVRVPYEAARVARAMGEACRAAGDLDGMILEFEIARRTFEVLGAWPDLERVPAAQSGDDAVGGLTPREREVLGIIATGRTNRAIATELGISEKTVARHLSNIYLKLGLSTRAAATAWAFRHRLA